MAIVTSTYRYKRPPRKRKPQTDWVPAVVTIDPKTRVAKKSRRSVGSEAAASGEMSDPGRVNKVQPSTPP